MQFAGARQRLIASNLANISTPGFRPMDVSVSGFQAQLADAVDRRRGQGGGDLHLENTQEVKANADRMNLSPSPIGDNLLFHDGNDRSLERLMQDLTENFTSYRVAAELMRGRVALLNIAIRERL